MDPLLEALRKLPVGQPPEIKRIINAQAVISSHATAEPRGYASAGLERLEISARSDLPDQGSPEVFVSYAWGDKTPDASQDARQRQEVVERMCETLPTDGWKVVRDAVAMGPGEQISTFMKRLTQADRVIVVLSDKYLHSPYSMAELYGIYQRSLEQKEEFLQRVIPLALDDAKFRDWRDRVACAKHWRTEFEDMEQNLRDLGKADFALYKSMKDWHNHVNDILADVNDVLSPHGFEIVKNDFASLRQMLSRRR
jgi:internalin A